MLITRIPPTVPELVARALADTPFLSQIIGAQPHQVATYAEIAASLAAEGWEAERHTLVAETLSPDLIAETAQALIAHAAELPSVPEAALFAAHEKIERALTTLSIARIALKAMGALPFVAAEAMLDDIETHYDAPRLALTRALGILQGAIERIETLPAAACPSEAV